MTEQQQQEQPPKETVECHDEDKLKLGDIIKGITYAMVVTGMQSSLFFSLSLSLSLSLPLPLSLSLSLSLSLQYSYDECS